MINIKELKVLLPRRIPSQSTLIGMEEAYFFVLFFVELQRRNLFDNIDSRGNAQLTHTYLVKRNAKGMGLSHMKHAHIGKIFLG